MRIPVIAVIVVTAVLALVLWRTWWLLPRGPWRRWYTVWCVLFLGAGAFIAAMPKGNIADGAFHTLSWVLFVWMTLCAGQCLFALLSLAAWPLRRGSRARKYTLWTACALSVFLVGAMLWGTAVTRWQIEVKTTEVPVKGLPKAFDGYRIVQISDLHVEGFGGDTAWMARLVDTVNSLRPDLVVFTGDLVSRRARELQPYMAQLGRLGARDGIYSILGNHDYEDYASWDTPAQKAASHQSLVEMQRQMGWRLLRDSTAWLRRGTDCMALIGVENIGDPPFHCYGSLPRAYPTLGDSVPKILLTHNPSHWADSIADRPGVNIPLTLSGHTHAMQIRLGPWSPAAWRYRAWGGLYADTLGRHIYVNEGLGTVGYPMRLGARPEVTLIIIHNT